LHHALLGLTQQALAVKLETTVTTVARYEANQRIPRARTLVRLANLAEQSGKPELAALFHQALGTEFREVTRKGYQAVIAAPHRKALGLRDMSTADFAKAKDLLAELWRISKTSQCRSRATQRCVRELAELMLEQGVQALEMEGA
jgi:transcriptional regulator with XRE-family HTH domain